jgi:mono/diheme cytochrome c family protein
MSPGPLTAWPEGQGGASAPNPCAGWTTVMRITVTLGVALALLLICSWTWAQTSQERRGADLARRLGCFACHTRKGPGANRAAPLNGVGARLSPRKLRLAITFPRQLHPGAQMPSYAYLPPEEQEALVDFLKTLK